MKRLRHVWRNYLDTRDRMVVIGMAGAALLSALGVGMVTAAHRARIEQDVACGDRVRAEDARWRAKGLAVVRSAVPCETR